jgi:hypothetical protein
MIFKTSVITPKKIQYLSITNINRLMLFMETVAVYFENPMKPINTLCVENAELFCVNVGGTYTIPLCFSELKDACMRSLYRTKKS